MSVSPSGRETSWSKDDGDSQAHDTSSSWPSRPSPSSSDPEPDPDPELELELDWTSVPSKRANGPASKTYTTNIHTFTIPIHLHSDFEHLVIKLQFAKNDDSCGQPNWFTGKWISKSLCKNYKVCFSLVFHTKEKGRNYASKIMVTWKSRKNSTRSTRINLKFWQADLEWPKI
jgi:hypothetical protein